MTLRVDFNADLGESFGVWERGADAELLECITSANVACGFHAGDPRTMSLTVEKVKDMGVALGAHPGYPDLLGFGRRRLETSADDVAAYVTYQVGALIGFANAAGLRLHHVKPHGALYVAALEDGTVAKAIADAVARVAPGAAVYTLAGSEMWHAASSLGLRPVAEFFADRPIRGDGSYDFFDWRDKVDLTPATVAARTVRAVEENLVLTVAGTTLKVMPETICLHSDTPGAASIGPVIRDALVRSDIEMAAA
jgi:5-oxoprolinase (ATP-hydrolysing) subunit A